MMRGISFVDGHFDRTYLYVHRICDLTPDNNMQL